MRGLAREPAPPGAQVSPLDQGPPCRTCDLGESPSALEGTTGSGGSAGKGTSLLPRQEQGQPQFFELTLHQAETKHKLHTDTTTGGGEQIAKAVMAVFFHAS